MRHPSCVIIISSASPSTARAGSSLCICVFSSTRSPRGQAGAPTETSDLLCVPDGRRKGQPTHRVIECKRNRVVTQTCFRNGVNSLSRDCELHCDFSDSVHFLRRRPVRLVARQSLWITPTLCQFPAPDIRGEWVHLVLAVM